MMIQDFSRERMYEHYSIEEINKIVNQETEEILEVYNPNYKIISN